MKKIIHYTDSIIYSVKTKFNEYILDKILRIILTNPEKLN